MAEQYDPMDVFVLVDGDVVTGFAEDSMVNCEPLEDKVELHKGTQGEGTFVINANDGGEVAISLAHNSPSLSMLNQLYHAAEIFSVNVVDRSEYGSSSAGGSEAMVASMDSMERGGDVSDREVTILVDDYQEIIN